MDFYIYRYYNISSTDINFIIDGKKISGKSNKFSIHSDVFAELFRQNNSKDIMINDTTYEVFQIVFNYVNTNKLNLNDTQDYVMAFEVYKFGQKYKMHELLIAVQDLLMKMINIDNSEEFYNLSIINNFDDFMQCYANTISSRTDEEMIKLNSISNNCLMNKLVSEYIKLSDYQSKLAGHLKRESQKSIINNGDENLNIFIDNIDLNSSVEEFECDISFRINGKTFHTNKTLLIKHSEVFEKMFSGLFRESTEQEIVIKDTDEESFEVMLTYVKTKSLLLNDNTGFDRVLEIYGIVHKYQMLGLMDMLEKKLSEMSNIENIESIYSYVVFYEMKRFIGYYIEILRDKTNEEIICLNKLSNNQLMKELKYISMTTY